MITIMIMTNTDDDDNNKDTYPSFMSYTVL